MALILMLECLVDSDRTVDVFLVPETVDEHGRHTKGLVCQEPVDGLFAPETIVGGVFGDLLPEADLVHVALSAELASRAGAHVGVILIEVAREPMGFVRPGGGLLIDVGDVLLAEGAVVEPVVPAPAIHHGIHGDRNLERRMRMHQRYQGKKAVVGYAEDADLAIRLRHILYQPVDCVVGIGRLIYRRRIERTVDGPVHHVVAFAAVLAANILHHANVATLNDWLGRVIVAVEAGREMDARCIGGQHGRVVRCSREQNPFSICAFGDQDDRMQLDAVPHGNHHVAPFVIHTEGGLLECGRRLAGVVRIARRRLTMGTPRDHGSNPCQSNHRNRSKRAAS